MKIIKVGAMWCPACIVMNKFWKDIKKEYNNINFIEYDLDIDENEIKKLNIGNILPEIIIYDDNNQEVKRIIGEKNKTEIEKEVGEVLNETK